MALTRLTEDYNLWMRINKFVQECFTLHGMDENTLAYMGSHLKELEAVEEECSVSINLMIMRRRMINQAFVDAGCVNAKKMWKYKLTMPGNMAANGGG